MPPSTTQKPAESGKQKKRKATEIDDIFSGGSGSKPTETTKDNSEPTKSTPVPAAPKALPEPDSKKKKKKDKLKHDESKSVVEVVDHSAASTSTKPAKSKGPAPKDDDGFADSRGSSSRKKVDGLNVYYADELGLVNDRKGGGGFRTMRGQERKVRVLMSRLILSYRHAALSL